MVTDKRYNMFRGDYVVKKCVNCKEEFETTHSKTRCCSRKCSNEYRFPKTQKPCSYCGENLKLAKHRLKKNNYCNQSCKSKHQSIINKGENNPNYQGLNKIVECSNCKADLNILNCTTYNSDGKMKQNFYCNQQCKAEHQKETLKGINNPKWRGGKIEVECSSCGESIFVSEYRLNVQVDFYCNQQCKAEHQKETMLWERNPNYLHGLSQEYRDRHRITQGYNKWRATVYERDNFTCQICSDDRGGNLVAHHLNSYNWDKENRTSVDNGVTLCSSCHAKLHKTIGYGNNTKHQYYDYISKSRGK